MFRVYFDNGQYVVGGADNVFDAVADALGCQYVRSRNVTKVDPITADVVVYRTK